MLNARSVLSTLCLFGLLATTGKAQSDDILSHAAFGYAVAVSGDQVFVGEPLNNKIPGRIHVFGRDPESGRWSHVGVIRQANDVVGNEFGISIAVDEGRLAAGARDGLHFFRADGIGGWAEVAVIRSDNPDTRLGESLAMSGGRLYATVRIRNQPIEVDAFEEQDDGEWVPTAAWTLPIFTGDRPVSIAVNGDRLIVGNPAHGVGRVYRFVLEDDAIVAVDTIHAPLGEVDAAHFGASVASRGGELLVGAPGTNQDAGMVFLYGARSDKPSATLLAETLEEDASLGSGVAFSNTVAVLGAKADLFGYGAAFIFERESGSDPWGFSQQISIETGSDYESITGADVRCSDGRAAEFSCKNLDLASFLTNASLGLEPGMQLSDVWGWTDPETGREYAIVCSFKATTFVEVTDPNNPVVLGTLSATPGTRPNWWRDAKTYRHYAYIVADNVGDHGLQIFDLTQLRRIEEPPVTFEPTAHYDGFDSAHNIIINEESGFGYVVGINGGGRTCGGGSHILDLENPLEPVFVGCFAHPGTGYTQEGATHDSQCVIYHGPDERYTGREICIASNQTAVSIADFTDKENVVPIAVARYPNSSYTHQGWLSEDQRYFFQNDEWDEIDGLTEGTRTMIWDLAELDDPVLSNTYVAENRATDHNYYVSGRYLYQSNYMSGLRILDVSNPESPVEVGYFDTVPWGADEPGYGGSWSNYPFFESGTIVVTSMEEGLFLLKRTDVAP